LERAPAHLNTRWGGKYNTDPELVEKEKRAHYGNPRYDEAARAVVYCNRMYDYTKKSNTRYEPSDDYSSGGESDY
jgi:hypothetical protein